MTLSEWLKLSDKTQWEFASQIGVTQGAISHIICGRQYPSMALAAKIKKATKGAVTADDMLPT